MSGSIAALFQRLTQGVYVVGVAHGEVRVARLCRRMTRRGRLSRGSGASAAPSDRRLN